MGASSSKNFPATSGSPTQYNNSVVQPSVSTNYKTVGLENIKANRWYKLLPTQSYDLSNGTQYTKSLRPDLQEEIVKSVKPLQTKFFRSTGDGFPNSRSIIFDDPSTGEEGAINFGKFNVALSKVKFLEKPEDNMIVSKAGVSFDKLKEGKYYKLVTPLSIDTFKVPNKLERDQINENLMSKFHKLSKLNEAKFDRPLFGDATVSRFNVIFDPEPTDKLRTFFNSYTRRNEQDRLLNEYLLDPVAYRGNYGLIKFIEGNGPNGGRKTLKRNHKLSKKRKMTYRK